jgi:hypothetical protein
MPNPNQEIILPLLKSLEDDIGRLAKKEEIITKLLPSGKMVETEMAQLFSKIKVGFTDLSSDLANLKKLIEQLNYANNFITDGLGENTHE